MPVQGLLWSWCWWHFGCGHPYIRSRIDSQLWLLWAFGCIGCGTFACGLGVDLERMGLCCFEDRNLCSFQSKADKELLRFGSGTMMGQSVGDSCHPAAIASVRLSGLASAPVSYYYLAPGRSPILLLHSDLKCKLSSTSTQSKFDPTEFEDLGHYFQPDCCVWFQRLFQKDLQQDSNITAVSNSCCLAS